jgi:hypothetical protein
MYMPRLSLYRPNKTADYEFLDKVIYEQFSIGGTDLFVHKFIGTENPTDEDATADQPQYSTQSERNIQDMLFLENRDRKYDKDIYTIRGIYNVSDTDFNLSQFGLFLQNDTLFITIHQNASVKTLGRKIMSGDVIELPHLADEYAANDYSVALKRFYVVEDVNRAAEGFSQTWYPHLYRLKLKQMVDSQEFKDILDLPANDDAGNTLKDLLSTFEKEMQINNAVVAQAEADSAKSGSDTTHLYTLQVDENGVPELNTVDVTDLDASSSIEADRINKAPERTGYTGYLLGDGIPPNGEAFGSGITFPTSTHVGDYFLRTDFLPNRLFRYDGSRWVKMEDAVRHTLSNSDTRNTQRTGFVNNTNESNIAGDTVKERQSLSKALKPKADN